MIFNESCIIHRLCGDVFATLELRVAGLSIAKYGRTDKIHNQTG